MAQAVNDSTVSTDEQKQKGDSREFDLEIRGRFARYVSAFVQIILPFLSVRYLFEAFDKIFDLNHKIRHWDKPVPPQPREKELLFGKIPNEGIARWLVSNILTVSFGVAISGVMAYYTNRTYKDIKTMYREALSYELDKKPEDISFRDMMKSQNNVIRTTKNALVSRSAVRFSTAFSFFLPWGLLNPAKYRNTNQLDDVGFRMGTGAVGTYLFSDGFLRKESFFESMQVLVDTRINHGNGDPYDIIEPKDIQHMVHIQRSTNKAYQPPAPNSQQAHDDMALSARVACALNQTYDNTPRTEDINFTVGKFIYLFGHDLLDSFPESIAYVDLAGKSKDMSEVKAVSAAIAQGTDSKEAFAKFGIQVPTRTQEQEIPAPPESPSKEEPPTPRTFAERVTQAKDRIPATARSPMEFALQEGTATPSPRQ